LLIFSIGFCVVVSITTSQDFQILIRLLSITKNIRKSSF